MPGAGERAYAYAKACGIIGKSFLGKRMSALAGVSRLSELDRLIFPGSFHELPERELLPDLERRILARAVRQILTIVGVYAVPPELLVRLLRSYEYADLKSALIALSGGETRAPLVTPLGRFAAVRFDAYPDLKAMIRDTEFEFLLTDLPKPEGDGGIDVTSIDSIAMQTKLDRHYYASLWASLFKLPKKDREGIEKILEEEISLRNIVWALRLRTYYGMNAEEARSHLIYLERRNGKSLAADAEASLELPLDTFSAWRNWRRAAFLNREQGGEHWKADPRWFQNAASGHLYHLVRHYFRRRPFAIDTVACFIKLKQFEEDILTSIAEGLGLSIPSRDVFSLLEVEV
jgi:vacuolar-type H+-ATPase subunit C/Vma6